MRDGFHLPPIHLPWETFADAGERAKRERANDNERWTDEFLAEVRDHVHGYEEQLASDDYGTRCLGISSLRDVYGIVPYHFRHEVFSESTLTLINGGK